MSHSDPIADMLTRIRNSVMRGKSVVETPSSKLRCWILDVLKDEGFIIGYEKTKNVNGHSELLINLKYVDETPVIREITRISKPGKRVYSNSTSIPLVHNGLGVSIISTSKGVMTDKNARSQNVGGEILCTVF